MKKRSLLVLAICLLSHFGHAQNNHPRTYINLNNEWSFHFAYDARRNAPVQHISLPHTWNGKDAFTGNIDYFRATGIYSRTIAYSASWEGKRIFLYFEGANAVADVFVNNVYVTQHKGGYTAFCTEITSFLKPGKENTLTVQVSNAASLDVLPLSGDFNVYGGLHRPAWLIVTNENCITPLDYASPGVYIGQNEISAQKALVTVLTKLSIQSKTGNTGVRTIIKDAAHTKIAEAGYTLAGTSDTSVRQDLVIPSPRLWNGKKDPYLYQVIVQVLQGQQVIDEVIQPLGLRNYKVDADSGLILNGSYYDLYGFGRHEDIEGRGSALLHSDHEKDMALIVESGATAMRLTHYPHSNYFYDLADKNGIALWTEIPLVGPGGYTGMGFVNKPSLKEHIKQQLTELIRQQYNHPSIFFWGLFNELKLDYDDPIPFVNELNALAKKEDPSRLTTCATFLGADVLNNVSDVMAWNKYFGWYGGRFEDVGAWADQVHKELPHKPIAISEYGAGANVHQHSFIMNAPKPDGDFHFEEWQTAFHESHWEALRKRRFIWGKFIWVFSDFGSSIRSEGNFKGLNDKGLITYNRETKKDAFYFYKANWSNIPMLYIAEKRNTNRTKNITTIKAYTNQPQATLFVNGKPEGSAIKDSLGRVLWKNVVLQPGKNFIVVKTTRGTLSDSCTWNVSKLKP